MPLERGHQDEIYRTLSLFGWATKQVQDATPCPHCHHIVYPFHKGWADYHAEIRTKNGPVAIKVEFKAGRERLEFKSLRRDQRKWMANWMASSGGEGYLWLQLGGKRVDAHDAEARQAWLIPYNCFLSQIVAIRRTCRVQYLPLSEVIVERYHMRYKQPSLTAQVLFEPFRLEWMNGYWRPCYAHPIWQSSRQEYHRFNS